MHILQSPVSQAHKRIGILFKLLVCRVVGDQRAHLRLDYTYARQICSNVSFEFFAELYSLYYDLDDPDRKVIPKKVVNWLDANIGAPGAGMLATGKPRKAAPKNLARNSHGSI